MPARPPQDKIDLYQALLDTQDEIEMKGKNLLYTSVNGHMFTVLKSEGELGMRLSKEDQAAFKAQYASGQFTNYGANIKDYVAVPDSLLQDTRKLAPWLAKSYAYTLTLKPK